MGFTPLRCLPHLLTKQPSELYVNALRPCTTMTIWQLSPAIIPFL